MMPYNTVWQNTANLFTNCLLFPGIDKLFRVNYTASITDALIKSNVGECCPWQRNKGRGRTLEPPELAGHGKVVAVRNPAKCPKGRKWNTAPIPYSDVTLNYRERVLRVGGG